MSTPSFDLACPHDHAAMEKVPVRGGKGFTVDRCPTCRAMWFDAVELQKVLAITGAASEIDSVPSRPRTRHGAHACPRCRSPLVVMSDAAQAHVAMLGCTVCGGLLLDQGVLLDLGEFTLGERLRAFFRLGDPPKPGAR